ncbi:beta-mannosidase [Natronorubrum sp. DTA7]|uniref:beta-mannosidase n=1 Tax=Natronorubrum sp. DTA7 TaxID=3447016 RepID=UPI003F83E217
MTRPNSSQRRHPQYHSLNGRWQFRADGEDGWTTGTVPGDVYSDLVDAGTIADPYDGDTELDVQWVGETDWTYRRTFELDAAVLDHDRIVLECLGIDTVAEISVNGTTVGTTDNMHRQYRFDLADVLEPGSNRITVRFRSPVEYAAAKKATHPYEVPLIRYPVDQPGRNFVRKAQCHFGWDWGPCLPGVGIWRDIRIVGYSSPRIEYTTTDQDHHDDGDVTVSARVGLDVPNSGAYDLVASIDGETTSREVVCDSGSETVDLELTVPDPDLWWPNGYGEQPLSTLEITVTDGATTHSIEERIGFRELSLVREDDDGGETFQFEVNGVPVYAKGANWIPTENMRGRVDEGDYESLLSSAAEANMNMLRVWGGGYYELDRFYELCDELGLLVWQDFMFSCALYPATDEFLETVEAEVRDQVRRLANHPSIALWCGNNENEMSLVSWFAEDDHIDELYGDYERLQERIAPVVAEEDPSRTFWPGSPSSGGFVGDDGGLDPYDEGRGDLHYWDVWHDGEPFEAYESVEPRFVSEFGYQSFASTELLSSVVPEDQLNPTAPIMEHHQRNEGGNRRILQRMADQFRIPFSFEKLVSLSQIQQALAMQTAIEHWRRCKPHCMGTLYWQLNDLWPCASWSSIEYGNRWKALHYVARRLYAPVLVSTVVDEESDELTVWLTSDRPEPVAGTLSIDAYTHDGERVSSQETSVSLEAQASRSVATISLADGPLGDVPSSSLLVRASYDGREGGGGGERVESYPAVTVFEPYKHLDLPDPELRVDVDGTDIALKTTTTALFVALETPSLSGTFSDNYFHLVPGERRTVAFDSTEGVDEQALREALTVTHLRDSS